MTQKWVLVIDDDDDVRDALSDFLKVYGWDSLGAVDGRDALDKLGEVDSLPCVILLDWMMPGMNGIGFRIEQLRRPRLEAIPVVGVSAHHDARAELERTGTKDFLKKPIDIDELVRVVTRYCSGCAV